MNAIIGHKTIQNSQFALPPCMIWDILLNYLGLDFFVGKIRGLS